MTCMIFAAGMGTRFKPWTDHHPKALALVNGKSLLHHNILYLQQYGIREIVLNVHHFPEQIIAAIKENNGWGSTIQISDESDDLLETGGGLMKARPLLEKGEAFMTLNVDILTNFDISSLMKFHRKMKPLVSFGITSRKTSRYFLFDEDNRLYGWRNVITGEEKVSIPKNGLKEMAYSCVAVFDPSIFDFIKEQGKFSLTETYLSLAKDHLILGYDHTGDKWVDVGKPESVTLAEQLFP